MSIPQSCRRLIDKAQRVAHGRFQRSSTRSAVRALIGEKPGPEEPAVPHTESTPGEAAVGQEAANRLSALVASTTALRARLGDELVHQHHRLRAAVLRARTFASRPEVEETRKAAEAARAEDADRTSFLRILTLPTWLFLAVIVLVFVVDVLFFFTLFTALGDVSSDRRFTTVEGWLALGASLITPMTQVVLADLGGRSIARARAETRLRLNARASGPADEVPNQTGDKWARLVGCWLWPFLTVLAALASSAFFMLVAFTRFSGEAARDGAISAPVGLLAMVFGALPLLVLTVGAFRRDLLADFRKLTIAKWDQVEQALERDKLLVDDGVRDLKLAWLALARVVTEIVDESNIAIALWAQLIMEASRESGRLGKLAPFTDSVKGIAGIPMNETAEAKDAWLAVPRLKQQNPISKPMPPWVLDSLRIDVTLLARHRPTATVGDPDDLTSTINRFEIEAAEESHASGPSLEAQTLNGKAPATQVVS